MKKLTIQVSGLVLFVVALLVAAAIAGVRVYDLSRQQKAIKRDYSLVNNISFGLLSVSRWRDLVVDAAEKQVENFRLSPPERDSLEKEIEAILNGLIDKADSIMRRPQHSLGGKIRQLAFHAFIKPKDLHKETPAFAHKIMSEVMRPRSRERLSYVVKNKLEDLGQQTYDSSYNIQRKESDSIFRKYGVSDMDAFNRRTAGLLTSVHHEMFMAVFVMLGALFLLLALWFLLRRRRELYRPLFILSIVMAFIFLFTGLTSVMIELDARIDALDFHLIGETISFKDQVIFFQSKSIVDVVILLFRTGKYDSILVGFLILCFSIVIPISKLLSTGFYINGSRPWMRGRIVHYFAFYSGKWSMADVMVVAIFMSYIGFNGIINDQISDLNIHTSAFTSIATNRTSLQPGYVIFVAYVLFGLVLSQLLQMRPDEGANAKASRSHRQN